MIPFNLNFNEDHSMKSKPTISLTLGALLFSGPMMATEFHAGTAQELQTSLSLAASNGEDDTVFLAAGIYNGNFTFNTSEAQSLTIKAETNALPGQIVLDGQQAGTVLNLNAGTMAANLTVEGITVKNGRGNPAGGLVVRTSGSLNLRRSVLRDSSSISWNNYAGNLSVIGPSAAIVSESEISGGVNTMTDSSINATTVRLEQNSIKGNFGALSINGKSILLSANQVSGYGDYGGISCSAYDYPVGGNCIVSNNVFQRNSVGDRSPIYVYSDGTASFVNNLVYQNTNTYYHGSGVVHVSGKSVVCQGNTFQDNQTQGIGGGAYLSAGNSLLCANNLVISNTAFRNETGYGGGGLTISSAATNWIMNNTIYGNSAPNGGGLYLGTGGDSSTSRNYVHNNIIWGNTASANGPDVYVVSGGALRSLYNNNYHGMAGLWDVALNNIDVAPLFVNALRGDYHLRANSLCLNSGNNAAPGLPVIDKDGNARIGNGVVDMGCYEHDSTDKHPADVNNNWVITSQEFTNYAKAWTTNGAWATGPNPIPMDYVTRAGFLFQTNSGTYQNLGGGKPLNWKP